MCESVLTPTEATPRIEHRKKVPKVRELRFQKLEIITKSQGI